MPNYQIQGTIHRAEPKNRIKLGSGARKEIHKENQSQGPGTRQNQDQEPGGLPQQAGSELLAGLKTVATGRNKWRV